MFGLRYLRLVFFIGLLLVSLSFSSIFVEDCSAVCSWYNGDWDYRYEIVINHSQVPNILIDFPILINITSQDFIDYAQEDGDDFVFVDCDGNKLNHEIENYSINSGNLYAWVNCSVSSVVNTTFYLYFGNDVCSNQENVHGVWNTSYDAVYHLLDNDSLHTNDSTINWFNGTKRDINQPNNTKCVVDSGYRFDGVNNNITINDNALLRIGTGDFTMSFWVYTPFPSVPAYWDGILVKGYTASAPKYCWGFVAYNGDNNKIAYSQSVDAGGSWGANLATTDLSDGWHFITVTRSSSTVNLYVDGAYYSQDTSAGDNLQNTNNLIVGNSHQNSYFDGYVDEVRLSFGICRNNSWIICENNTIFNCSDGKFFVVGDLELGSEGNFVPELVYVLPVNESLNVSILIDINVTISDINGDNIDITFELSNYWSYSLESQTNGTIIWYLNHTLDFETNYTLWVNITDGIQYNRSNIWFITCSIDYLFYTKEQVDANCSDDAFFEGGIALDTNLLEFLIILFLCYMIYKISLDYGFVHYLLVGAIFLIYFSDHDNILTLFGNNETGYAIFTVVILYGLVMSTYKIVKHYQSKGKKG